MDLQGYTRGRGRAIRNQQTVPKSPSFQNAQNQLLSDLTAFQNAQNQILKTPTNDLPPSLSQYALPEMHQTSSLMNSEMLLPLNLPVKSLNRVNSLPIYQLPVNLQVEKKNFVDQNNNNETNYNVFNQYKLKNNPKNSQIFQKKKSWNTFQTNDDDDDDTCSICDRSDKHVLCKICGHSWKGRRRIKCEKHPSTVMLMDSANCPQCHSVELKEV